MRCATAPSSSATERTVLTLARVFSVASPTRLTSSAVSIVRLAATSTLRAISCVAAPCSVTAAAIAPLIAPMSRMVPSIAAIAAIERLVACCMSAICLAMSSVAFPVWPASALTSPATTAKPRPASPARAASIVALSASRLVCSAISVMRLTTSPMRLAASLNSCTAVLVRSASPTAFSAMAFDCATWRSISITEAASSSVADAMSRTLADASADADVAPSVRCEARSAASPSCVAESSI